MNSASCSLLTAQWPDVALDEDRPNLLHAARLALSGQLLNAIFHQIHQPLVAARMRARNGRDLIDAGSPCPEALREILTDIEDCASFAVDIGARLRLLADKRPLEIEPIDLNEAIRDVASLAEIHAQAQGVTLELRLAPVPLVQADRVSVQHAILDLIVNGIEAERSQPGHRVVVETRATASAIEVRVADTGEGVPPRIRDRIFEPFFTTKPEGTGLGLSIARSIVESHGGRLDVEDRLVPGACFRIALPSSAAAH